MLLAKLFELMGVLGVNMLLSGKTAIITGCNRGIGKAILEKFVENGADVFAVIRKETPEFLSLIDNLEKIYDCNITPIYADFSDMMQLKSAAKQIMSSKKDIDVLVNNAGITYNALYQMSSLDKMEEVFQINYFAPMIFTQYIVRQMVKSGHGSIINLSSSAAIDANPGRGVYGASKAALLCSTRVIAAELGNKGIRANCIAPGITDTNMVSESMSSEIISETVGKTMLKRMGKPMDIANTALFLASDMSSYVTGQVIRVDGGLRR